MFLLLNQEENEAKKSVVVLIFQHLYKQFWSESLQRQILMLLVLLCAVLMDARGMHFEKSFLKAVVELKVYVSHGK